MKIYTNLEKITISESLQLESFEGEIWKPITDCEGRYEISNYGRVKSLKRFAYSNGRKIRRVDERILLQNFDKNGYKKVSLTTNKLISTNNIIHRLVAIAFIPNPKNKPQINHIKEIKNLNWVDELEWATCKENNNHGRKIQKTKIALFNGKNSKPVIQLTEDGKFIKRWISASDASRNGFSRKSVSYCTIHRDKTHKGFKWVLEKFTRANKGWK